MPNENRVAIITGAARPWGIGRATAVALARRGYNIAIADVNESWGSEGAADIAKETSQAAIFVKTDVSQRDQVFAMVDRVLSEFGRVDALVNDAAIGGASKTEDFTDADFWRVISVNLLGAMLCTQAVVKPMKERNYGRVVNVASTAPWNPPAPDTSSVSLYNASKGGLIGWTKSAAVELAQYGIVVNVVAVGGLSTGMGGDRPPTPEMDEHMLKAVHRGALPWGRLIKAEETAELLADVADAKSHALLGATIHASGGRVLPL